MRAGAELWETVKIYHSDGVDCVQDRDLLLPVLTTDQPHANVRVVCLVPKDKGNKVPKFNPDNHEHAPL